MKKIKISPILMGTPLTEQELKSIIGGITAVTRSCYCTFTHGDGTITSKSNDNITDETACSMFCSNQCRDHEVNCINYTFKYTVQG